MPIRKLRTPPEDNLLVNAKGFQAYLARRVHVTKAAINHVFRGEIRASVDMAAKLEHEFIRIGIPLTRWDFLYGMQPGQTLVDYVKERTLGFRGYEDYNNAYEYPRS